MNASFMFISHLYELQIIVNLEKNPLIDLLQYEIEFLRKKSLKYFEKKTSSNIPEFLKTLEDENFLEF